MCGIAGILRWERVPEEAEIRRMNVAIAHRGPDGEGIHCEGPVALGHRRLAIIDPEGGKQPVANEDRTVWIVYNGEVYNYRELQAELQRAGHHFATRCDTEVIVHAYEEWGTACVERFRGMFGFCIADFRRRQLFLARDHFGIKPLYYRRGPGFFAFASELPALRAVDAPVPTGSLQALEFFLRYQYIPSPLTIYEDTCKLPPATRMVVNFDGTTSGPERYWDLHFTPEDGGSDEDWLEQAEAVIRESVRAHLVADVPFGCFCSGGTDSSLVARYMSELLDQPVTAFSIGFEQPQYSELPYARQVAETCKLDLRTEIVRGDAMDFLPDLVAHYGEPFGDSSAVPTWHVSRLARREVPMVLTGDGGDEGFAGYASYWRWLLGDGMVRVLGHLEASPTTGRRLLRLARLAPRLLYWRYLAPPDPHDWEHYMLFLRAAARRALWQPPFRPLVDEPCALFAEATRRAAGLDRLAQAQYLDFQTYLPGDILTKVDVASMYHGLETRVPLIDLEVIKFATRLPLRQRFCARTLNLPVGKPLLKRLLARRFPASFVHRRKQGFGIPRAEWFLPGGPAREMLEPLLKDPASRLREFFVPAELEAHLLRHDLEDDHSGPLWLLLVLGLWLAQNPQVQFR